MKRLAKPGLLIWLVVLPLLIWWALRAVPFGSVWSMLAQLNLAGLLALAALDAVIVMLFNGRGWLILRSFGCRVNYLWLAAYRLSAFSISYFTPGQQFGGEPLQVYWLHKRHQMPATTALTSVALDRLFDMLSNFTFLMAGIVIVLRAGLLNGTTAVDPRAITWLAGLFLLPLAYLLAIWSGRSPLVWALTRLPRKLRNHSRLAGIAGSVAVAERQAGSLLRRKPATILWLGLVSGAVWLLTLAEFWLMVHLFGQNLTLVQTILALTAARLAFLTPLPGGLGALEAGQVLAMQAIGLEPALGISVSLLIRARDISFGLAGVGISAWLSRETSNVPVSGQAADYS